MKVKVGPRTYRMSREEYQGLLKVAKEQVPMGVFALEKNDYKLAAERQQLTNRLNEALCSVNNIAAYKAVLAHQGIIKTKKTRKPLEEYTEQQTRELFAVLKEIVKEK